MDLNQRIALLIGKMALQAEDSAARSEQLLATLNRYDLLKQCIRSGQVPDEDVPKLLKDDAEFEKWYEANK